MPLVGKKKLLASFTNIVIVLAEMQFIISLEMFGENLKFLGAR